MEPFRLEELLKDRPGFIFRKSDRTISAGAPAPLTGSAGFLSPMGVLRGWRIGLSIMRAAEAALSLLLLSFLNRQNRAFPRFGHGKEGTVFFWKSVSRR